MTAQPSDQELANAFNQFMKERVFGLVASVDRPKNPDETYPMASGVILNSREGCVLVTAGHYLQAVAAWKEQGRLLGLGVLASTNAVISALLSLDLKQLQVRYSDAVDVGFVVLDDQIVQGIAQRGGKAVSTQKIGAPGRVPDRFFLVGHASAYSKVSAELIASTEQGPNRMEWRLLKLSDIAAAFVELRLDGIGDAPHTCQFTPTKSKVHDYSGTSGGPIFGFKNGATFDDYCVFAFQSKQILAATRDQKAKYLIATAAEAAKQVVNDCMGGKGDA